MHLFSFTAESRASLEADVEEDATKVAMEATEHVAALYHFTPCQRDELGMEKRIRIEPTEASATDWTGISNKLRDGRPPMNVLATFMQYSDGQQLQDYVEYTGVSTPVMRLMFVFTPEQRAKVLEDFSV